MRRTLTSLLFGAIVTGLFLFGLAWMTNLQEREWSSNSRTFNSQVTFVLAILGIVMGASVLNHALNRPRSPGIDATESKHNPTLAGRSEHPLRDRLLDG